MPQLQNFAQMQRCAALAFSLWLAAGCGAATAQAAGSGHITVQVDATNTGQKLLQVSERIPVEPGPLRLRFARWLRGFHGPYGDVTQVAGSKSKAPASACPGDVTRPTRSRS